MIASFHEFDIVDQGLKAPLPSVGYYGKKISLKSFVKSMLKAWMSDESDTLTLKPCSLFLIKFQDFLHV